MTGFDGVEESQCLDLPLTTVVTPADGVCAAGLEMPIEKIEQGDDRPPRQIVIPVRLHIGATT